MKQYNSHIVTTTTEACLRITNGNVGFTPINFDSYKQELHIDDIWVGSRTVLEQDNRFKHIIPYIVVRKDDTYLVYQRTSSGGESRLHGNHSIGFGGHIDVVDINLSKDYQTIDVVDTIFTSAKRELKEELNIIDSELYILGFLYDDSNEVGNVHLGVVMLCDVSEELETPENQIELKGFKTLDELSQYDNFETWSKMLIEHFLPNINSLMYKRLRCGI